MTLVDAARIALKTKNVKLAHKIVRRAFRENPEIGAGLGFAICSKLKTIANDFVPILVTLGLPEQPSKDLQASLQNTKYLSELFINKSLDANQEYPSEMRALLGKVEQAAKKFQSELLRLTRAYNIYSPQVQVMADAVLQTMTRIDEAKRSFDQLFRSMTTYY